MLPSVGAVRAAPAAAAAPAVDDSCPAAAAGCCAAAAATARCCRWVLSYFAILLLFAMNASQSYFQTKNAITLIILLLIARR